jgi:putative ABC transport system permease protein
MIKHFFVTIYRNILKDKVLSLINLSNLAIGFTTFIVLGMVVNYEFNYDKSNVNYDRIYRVQTKQEDSFPINYCTYSPAAFRYHLMADLPDVEQVLLMREASGQFFTLPNGQQLSEKYGYWSENSVFDIFTIRTKEGSTAHALTDPNTIVLSETLEKKLFPTGDAVGKQVVIGKRHPVTVTAVYHDFPLNSNMKPSYLISLATFEALPENKTFQNNWTYINNDNYVLLKKGADPQTVDAKIKDAFKNVKDYEKSSPYLHPLSRLHISPNSQADMYIGLSILSLAGILVLVLSCVNYMNLSLANVTRRASEIGIKKVVGFSKKAIAIQFMTETLSITFVAMLIGLVIARALLPLMGWILQTPFEFKLSENTNLLFVVLAAAVIAGLVSGVYPSLVLSAYNPVKVLKGKLFSGAGKTINMKKVLTATQFSISLFMLIVSFILYTHVNFILNKDLGFDSKNILFAELNVSEKINFENIRQRLLQHPEIADASISSTIPFEGNIGGYISWEGGGQNEKVMISRNYVNYDFIPTFNIPMAAGRNFSKDYPADEKSCVINETAAKTIGMTDPVGKRIFLYGNTYSIIGVVKDFHPFSVHNPIPTYVMLFSPNEFSGSKVLTVRFTPGNEQRARQIATAELDKVIPNDPYEFKDFSEVFFLDKAIWFWQVMKRVFFFFAIITLLVSSIGLFGLILFSTKCRTKEIGIRKVLGSSVGAIYQQLSTEVFGLIGFAAIVAGPAAWYIYKVMPGAYKEPLNLSEFVLAIALVTAVAFITISYHVLKVAMSNPVEAIKYE